MNAAAPGGAPPAANQFYKLPDPPCLGEALMRVTLVTTLTFVRKHIFYLLALSSPGKLSDSYLRMS
jgi:hypothetical protein